MSRRFGSPLILDLKVGGQGVSASVTPGASAVPVSFTAPTLKQAIGADNYPLCRGIMTKNVVVVDQPGSGASVINWDELFRINQSFNTNVPKFGLMHDRSVFTGPIAKHIAEFFALGYGYCDSARIQIAAANGDTTVTLYTFLPFTNETVEDPEAFWIWVGWMRDMELTFTVAPENCLEAVSTGAVIKAPCTLTAWLECYTSPQAVLPAISQWNRYTTNAANGQNLALLENIGKNGNGINNAEKRSRLMAVIELMAELGFGGASSGDIFTSFGCSELHQDQTTNIDGFMTSFRSAIQRAGSPGALTAADPAHPGAGGLMTNNATPAGTYFDQHLKFIPWRYTAPNGRIEYAPKIEGTITLNRGFTATPTNGLHVIITNEIRQLTPDAKNSLQSDAGIPANTPRSIFSSRPLRKEQQFGHGELIHTRR